MKYVLPVLLLVILSLGAVSVKAQENQVTLTITFQGQPVVNATVDVYLNGSIVASTTTNGSGSCLIPSGAYTLFIALGNKTYAIIDYNTTTTGATAIQVEITTTDTKVNTTANIPVPVKITANNVKDLPITTDFILYSNINVALTFPQEVMYQLTRYTLKEIRVNNETMTTNSFTLTTGDYLVEAKYEKVVTMLFTLTSPWMILIIAVVILGIAMVIITMRKVIPSKTPY